MIGGVRAEQVMVAIRSRVVAKVVKVAGNQLTLELPEGTNVPIEAKSVVIDVQREGDQAPDNGSNARKPDTEPSELGKALKAAKARIKASGKRMLSWEELDALFDEMRGRA
jgi:hypothetical protein